MKTQKEIRVHYCQKDITKILDEHLLDEQIRAIEEWLKQRKEAKLDEQAKKYTYLNPI